MPERQEGPNYWPELPRPVNWKNFGKFEGAPKLGRKYCSVCGRWRMLSDFGVSIYSRTGTPLIWQNACRTCERARNRIRNGHKPRRVGRAKGEEARAAQREAQTKRMADPEYRAAKREYDRIWKEGRRRAAGIQPRRLKKQRVVGSASERLSNKQLRMRFLQLQKEHGLTTGDVARKLDWWARDRPDEARVARMLGLRDAYTHGRVLRASSVSYPNAVRLADALGMDAHEVGA